jgi:hypothetical protein
VDAVGTDEQLACRLATISEAGRHNLVVLLECNAAGAEGDVLVAQDGA